MNLYVNKIAKVICMTSKEIKCPNIIGIGNLDGSDSSLAKVSSATVASLRTTFNNSVRSAFKTYYDQNYGYVNWSAGIEIHHIRPLEYGGTNDFDNLIPLYADKHLQFSNWWSNYK